MDPGADKGKGIVFLPTLVEDSAQVFLQVLIEMVVLKIKWLRGCSQLAQKLRHSTSLYFDICCSLIAPAQIYMPWKADLHGC